MNTITNKEMNNLVQQYNNEGWIAFVYPRKKTVSLNGFRSISYQEAKRKIKEALTKINN